MAIGTTVKVGWNATKVQRGMAGLKGRFRAFSHKLGGAMKTGMKVAIGAIVASFAAATAATVVYFNKFRKQMDRVGKIAKRFDAGTDEVQKLGVAAELSGGNLEVLTKGLQTLTRYAIKAGQEGGATYARAFESLGINAAVFANMGMTGQVLELNRAFLEGGRDAEKFAAILEVMGARSGGELIPMIGMEGLADLLGEIRTVSPEVIRLMEKFNDSLTVFRQNMRAGAGKLIENAGASIEVLIGMFENAGLAINEAVSGRPELLKAGLKLYGVIIQEWATLAGKNAGIALAKGMAGAGETFNKTMKESMPWWNPAGKFVHSLQEKFFGNVKKDFLPIQPSAYQSPAEKSARAEYQKLKEATKQGVVEAMTDPRVQFNRGGETFFPADPFNKRGADLGAKWGR